MFGRVILMAQSVKDIMTRRTVTMDRETPVLDAAKAMREADIGDVMVTESDRLCGIVTDRDIVVRVLADERDPSATQLGAICSGDVVSVAPDDSIDMAVAKIRDRGIRRLPVLENGQPVGILSIGDLAIERDSDSALADISAAPPNE